MNALKVRTARATRVAVAAFLIVCVLLAAPSLAAKKKKKEDEQPTKSYVLPYMIVITMVSVGLMTICRPGSRQDPGDATKKKQNAE